MPDTEKRRGRAFWTLRRVLVLAGILIVAGVAATIWWSGQSYRAFSLETLNSSAAITVRSSVAGRIDQVYAKRLNSIMRLWGRSTNLKEAVAKEDAEARTTYAASMFNVREVKEGQVVLRELLVYDTEFNLLARAGDGSGDGASLVLGNAEYRAWLRGRERRAARLPVGRRFASEGGVPLFSMVGPVGGLKYTGFVEVIVDPLGELADIGEVLGGRLEILDKAGEVLFVSEPPGSAEGTGTGEAATATEDAAGPETGPETGPEAGVRLATIGFDVEDPAGGAWARIRFTRDISAFANGLEAVTTRAFIAFLAGIAGILIVVWLLLRLAIFRNLDRFAVAALELADGNANVRIPETGRDEIGRVGTAMDRLRTTVSGVFLMKHLVENTPTPTALIGADGRVEILNAAARAVLAVENAAGLQTNFLGLGDDDARNLTDPDGTPLSVRIAWGDRVFAVSSAPVRNGEGAFIGSMLAWSDVTAAEEAKHLTEDLLEKALEVVEAVAAQSRQLEATAGDLNRQSDDNIERTGQASDIVQDAAGDINLVAGSTRDLAESIREADRQAGEASIVSRDALEKAERGHDRIRSLEEASNRIGSIVDLITAIAHRTRLLSLNATIEAQRAGERGRGFNVVANEVKHLADQTAEATANISGLTQEIRTHIGDTTSVMTEMREIIEAVNGFQSAIAESVKAQNAATEDMSGRIARIASGSGTIENIIGDVNLNANRTRENARSLRDAATGLSRSAESMRGQMALFRRHFLESGS